MMTDKLLSTAVVGSYPHPRWLVDERALSGRVPRVRVMDIWRVGLGQLAQAQDDATRLSILDMERAGVDIITDGEIRRESYSNHFATAKRIAVQAINHALDGAAGSRATVNMGHIRCT